MSRPASEPSPRGEGAPQGRMRGDFPTQRNGYEFIGWFTASGAPYNEETKLTDANTVLYDKTDPENYTDPMNKWGEIEGEGYNSDAQDSSGNPRNRFWILKKIDLYGRWRKEIDGAPGIGTTLFYVIGSVLFLGAGIVLVTKRRVRE